MRTIERILLTTNLLPDSDRAMERAVQLAVQHGADLTALYAMQPGDGLSASPYDRMTPHDIEAEMRRHLQAIPQAAALAPLVTVIKGGIDEAAADFAEMWKPDIMVAGVHRSDTLQDMFSVTTIEKISVASPVPLLVVRNKPFAPYASALVPVDFLDNSAASVVSAMALVPQGNVHLLHVFDVPGDASLLPPHSTQGFDEEFQGLLAGVEIGPRIVGTSVRHGFAMSEIVEAAHAELPDVIVMGTKGRRGVGRVLMGSTAHDVLERLPSDVLLVRAP